MLLPPKTKLLLLSILVAVVFTLLLYSFNIHVRIGYYIYALFMILVSILLYALLAKFVSKAKLAI